MLNLDFRWRLCMWLLLKMFHSVLSAFYKYFWRLNFYRFRYALWTTEWNLRPMLCLPFNIYTLHTNGLVEHSNRKSETTRNELDACCVGRNENMKMDFYLKMVKRSLFRTNFKLKQKKKYNIFVIHILNSYDFLLNILWTNKLGTNDWRWNNYRYHIFSSSLFLWK